MASLNKVMLIGNLTRDPELRYTPNGAAVADFAIAVNRTWQTDAGEKMEETTFVDITVWARLAENCGKYLTKGKPVFIEGRLSMDQWEDKATGQKRSRLKVIANDVQFLGTADKAGEGAQRTSGGAPASNGKYSQKRETGNASGGAQRPPSRPPPQDDEFGEGPITQGMEEDDIPF